MKNPPIKRQEWFVIALVVFVLVPLVMGGFYMLAAHQHDAVFMRINAESLKQVV